MPRTNVTVLRPTCADAAAESAQTRGLRSVSDTPKLCKLGHVRESWLLLDAMLTWEAMVEYELTGWGFPRERRGFAAVGQTGPPGRDCTDVMAGLTTGLSKSINFRPSLVSYCSLSDIVDLHPSSEK